MPGPNSAWKQTIEDPSQQKHRQHYQRGQNEAQTTEKEPALHRMLSRLVDASSQQRVVAAVRPPGDVEHIAEHRNRADHNLDRHIGHHARHRDIGDAAHPGRDDDDAGGDAADQVADAGNEADDAVEPEADRSAGNPDEVVQHMRQQVEVLVVEGLAAAFHARRQDLGFRGKRHRTPTVARRIARPRRQCYNSSIRRL